MKKIGSIKFLFSSRGVSRWGRRLGTVARRFSFLPYKQVGIIRQYADCLKAHGVRGTFFIPAILLEKYLSQISSIDPKVIEWGIHGWVHTDHSQLQYDQQVAQISRAVEIFDRCGISFQGFRCPYLRFNEHTHKALMAVGRFKFDSSASLVWEDVYGPRRQHYAWIRDFYKARTYGQASAIPCLEDRLMEIPVSLPDDDICIDRESLGPAEILGMWGGMARTCHRNGEVFVLQLHPERFLELQPVLEALIMQVKALQPAVWIATLSDVARWKKDHPQDAWPQPYRGAFCITGDIDAVTIQDFFSRLREW